MAELSTFDALRLRTEEQLVQLIHRDLERIRQACQALRSAETWADAGELYRQAQKAHFEVSRLIPLADGITEHERIRVESKLECLKGLLERTVESESNAVCLTC